MENNPDWANTRENRLQGGGGRFPGGAPEGFTETFQRENNSQNSTWAWLAISAFVMGAGLLFVKLYPRSRY